jgi:hypothetical protein
MPKTLGLPTDYLYVIVDKKFYRLNKDQITLPENEITDETDEPEVVHTFEDLAEKQVVVANLPAPPPGEHADSCTCVAINMDTFEPTLSRKIRYAKANAKKPTPSTSRKK